MTAACHCEVCRLQEARVLASLYLGSPTACQEVGGCAKEWGESACVPCPRPTPSQGDIQELLISPDPQAAFRACELYLPGCGTLDPVTTGVSGGEAWASPDQRSRPESPLAPGLSGSEF